MWSPGSRAGTDRCRRRGKAWEEAMALLVIHHKVRDYAAWRPIYDAHESSRSAAGITNGKVFRRAEEPNELVILFNVADVARARAWTASPSASSMNCTLLDSLVIVERNDIFGRCTQARVKLSGNPVVS